MANITQLVFLLLLGSSATFSLQAQEPSKMQLQPCGTAPYTDPWLKTYLERPGDLAMSRSQDTLYVGMQVHLVARDNGTGRFSPERLLAAFCRLNEDFAPAAIRFYFKYDWHLIDSTAWYTHADLTDGIAMMTANDVPDALNIYFVADPAGNCGYNIPYGGVAISHSCAAPNDHTWAHEVGHSLSLQHTFIGWEGKQYNYTNPTPDTLTYDYTYFHAQPDTLVPAPPDTALVEYVDGSNCGIAADKFCDTPPDYLSYRWDCDAQGFSLTKQKDPSGADFYSDGSLFMSYANDICSNRFSDEQIAAMRANLLSVKQPWLAPGATAGVIDAVPELLSPLNGQLTPANGMEFHWSAVTAATQYLVEASRFSSFTLKEIETVTSDTFFVGGQLSPGKTYYWRVRPFNNWSACTNFSSTGSFKTDLGTGTLGTVDEAGIRLYPSMLSAGQPFYLQLPEQWLNREVHCRLFDSVGRMVFDNSQRFAQPVTPLDWLNERQGAGIYRLVLQSGSDLACLSIVLVP